MKWMIPVAAIGMLVAVPAHADGYAERRVETERMTTAPQAAAPGVVIIEEQAQLQDRFPGQGLDNPSGIAGQNDLRNEQAGPGAGNQPGELDPSELVPGVTVAPPGPYVR